MKKLIIYVLIAIFMMTLISSCGDSSQKKIYDDDALIVQKGENFNMKEYSMGEVDIGHSFSMSGFIGIKTIYTLNAKADSTVSMDYDSSTYSGKFKCVYVDANNTLKMIVEQDGSGKLTLTVPKGENSIKIVGVNAEFDLTTNVQNSDGNVEITYIN